MLNTGPHMPSRWQWWKESVHEFFSVLSNPFTYSPRKNPEIAFGLLWGLPVPIFAFGIHTYACGLNFQFNTCKNSCCLPMYMMML